MGSGGFGPGAGLGGSISIIAGDKVCEFFANWSLSEMGKEEVCVVNN